MGARFGPATSAKGKLGLRVEGFFGAGVVDVFLLEREAWGDAMTAYAQALKRVQVDVQTGRRARGAGFEWPAAAWQVQTECPDAPCCMAWQPLSRAQLAECLGADAPRGSRYLSPVAALQAARPLAPSCLAAIAGVRVVLAKDTALGPGTALTGPASWTSSWSNQTDHSSTCMP